jgi:light-independent protochlorophyllide reductase subunit B
MKAEPVLAAEPESASVAIQLPVPAGTEAASASIAAGAGPLIWTSEAERELKKIPFFVRGKARRNTERFASERGLGPITVDTLYDAKSHFGR